MTDDQDPRLSPPTTKTGRLQRALLALLRQHERGGGLPTNNRFLWYELVQGRTVDKDKARGHPGVTGRGIDQDVNTALTILRERGIIPWTWIVDETRSTYLYTGARSVLAGLRARLEYVRLDPWDGKPPLILAESSSLAGTLEVLAGDYCLDLAGTNGQVGGFLHTEVVPLLEAFPGRPVGYLGDLNLSGDQIEDNTHRVLESYDPGLADPGRWQRLALTEAQVDRLVAERYGGDRASLVITKVDGRHKRRFCCASDNPARGHPSVETEALSQEAIVAVVRAWLDDLLLPERLADVLVRERAQRAALVAALGRLDGDGGYR